MGRGGGLVVSVLAFNYFESRWRPQFFSAKMLLEKNENQKESGVGPLFQDSR